MIKRSLFFLYFLVSASLIFGQMDSNSITVTGLVSTNAQPDQFGIAVTVLSPLDASLDSIVAALQGSGITAANFNGLGVYPPPYYPPPPPGEPITLQLQWGFSLGVPFSKLTDTLSSLSSVQQSLNKKNAGLKLTFYVSGMQYSPQLQQSATCKLSDAIADARARAQKLADAAGFGVGSILAISGPSSIGSYVPFATVYTPLVQGCSATVKFALTRF